MGFRCRLTKKTDRTESRRSCTKCGRIGHLATTCEAPDKRHDKIGIEIEGYWKDVGAAQRVAAEVTGSQGNSDASLAGTSSCRGADADCECDGEGCDTCEEESEPCDRRNCTRCGLRAWEFQTKPGSIGETLRQLTKLYPDGTSGACGLHVHMSFLDNSDITMLASAEFFAYFARRWKDWGERLNIKGAFWTRLNGVNRYCKPNTDEDFQNALVTSCGERYRQINFHAWNKYKTVEFRLLPMFQSAEIAVKAIEELVDMVEAYLADARFEHAAECEDLAKISHTQLQAAGVVGVTAPSVEIEIPTEIDPVAMRSLLPESIDSEVEISDITDVAPGAIVMPAWKAQTSGQEMLTKLVSGHFTPKLKKLGAGTPTNS